MKTVRFLFLVPIVFVLGCSSEESSRLETASQPKSVSRPASGEEKIAVSELAKWQFLGIGQADIDESENALRMSEGADSKGVTIVSPEKYGGDVVVTFRVKPLNFETVHVVMLSVSDKDTGEDIQIPADYDGNFGFWTMENVQNYVFAFHNAAHKRKPFILRNPGSNLIIEADANVTGERWLDIEIGRHGRKLWMKIDGETVVENTDTESEGLTGGNICFRLRGVPGKAASALFRDVVIREKNLGSSQ